MWACQSVAISHMTEHPRPLREPVVLSRSKTFQKRCFQSEIRIFLYAWILWRYIVYSKVYSFRVTCPIHLLEQNHWAWLLSIETRALCSSVFIWAWCRRTECKICQQDAEQKKSKCVNKIQNKGTQNMLARYRTTKRKMIMSHCWHAPGACNAAIVFFSRNIG